MPKPLKKYFKIVAHEADMGLESYGNDLNELFENTAYALFSLITDMEKVGQGITRHIAIHDGDELLIVFLNELLYVWETERFIPASLSVTAEGGRVEADMAGEIFDPDKHPVYREVKAVTYHQFTIRHEGGHVRATIFLDI